MDARYEGISADCNQLFFRNRKQSTIIPNTLLYIPTSRPMTVKVAGNNIKFAACHNTFPDWFNGTTLLRLPNFTQQKGRKTGLFG